MRSAKLYGICAFRKTSRRAGALCVFVWLVLTFAISEITYRRLSPDLDDDRDQFASYSVSMYCVLCHAFCFPSGHRACRLGATEVVDRHEFVDKHTEDLFRPILDQLKTLGVSNFVTEVSPMNRV